MKDKELLWCAIDKDYRLNKELSEQEIDRRNKIAYSIAILKTLDDEAMYFLIKEVLGRMHDGELKAKMDFYEWLQPYLIKLEATDNNNDDLISQKRKKATRILRSMNVLLYREIRFEHGRRGKLDEFTDWIFSLDRNYDDASVLLNIF